MPCTAAPRLRGNLPPQSWLKKTTKLIIEGGNNYLITVKGNQPRLLTQLKTIATGQKPCDQFFDIEKTRGRTTCRIVKVFTDLRSIDIDWLGLKSLIQIERIGIRSGKKYLQTNYYISSVISKATNFAKGIRYSLGN